MNFRHAHTGPGDAVFRFGESWKYFVGFALIPVRDSSDFFGHAVGVSVFDRSTQGFLKDNGVLNVEAIAMGSPHPADIVVDARVTKVWMHVYFFWTPG